MVKSYQRKTQSTNPVDDNVPYYGTSLDHMVTIPKQSNLNTLNIMNSSTTPSTRAVSPTSQTLRRANKSTSPSYSPNSSPSLSNPPHLQSNTKRSSTPDPKKFLDIDLKNIATGSLLESPKGSPRSPKNNSESPRLKGSEPLGCESWEVVSKQDLDDRETLAAERFLKFLHGQPVDVKQKFGSFTNTDYLFSDNEGERACVKFIRLEELEKLMKENHPKNEKQYIHDWLNEIPQPTFEKTPKSQTEEVSLVVLSNQFQTFKSVFNQMSEKIFKKWILSHRLERIVIDLVQKYQDTKKQLDNVNNETIHEVVKMEVQKQLKTVKASEEMGIRSKEGFLKDIVRKEMEKITQKADVILSEMKERNVQTKIDNSVEEAVDKILRETEEQFTFLTSSIGDIKKDVNDLKIKYRNEHKPLDMKPESGSLQDLENLKQYLESKTTEFTRNMVNQLENTSNLLDRCNTIEKQSEKKIKDFQLRMERELKEIKTKIDHSNFDHESTTTVQKQFQTMEKHFNDILLQKRSTEEESRRAIESIIKSNLMYTEDIHGLHIEQKTLESRLEEKEEDFVNVNNLISNLMQFKTETVQKLENLETKRIEESSDFNKLSILLENVSSHLRDIEQRHNFEKLSKTVEESKEKVNYLQNSYISEICNVKKDVLTMVEQIGAEQLRLNQSKLDEIIEANRLLSEKETGLRTKCLQATNEISMEISNVQTMVSSLNDKYAEITHTLNDQTIHQKLSEENVENLIIEVNTLRDLTGNHVSELRNQVNLMNDSKEESRNNVSEMVARVTSLETKIDNFRTDISKEMQMNMKYQNESNKCIESSILNLENSRNDNKMLIQNLDRKMVEKYSEIDKYLGDLKREQSNTCEALFKDKIALSEKSILALQEHVHSQQSNLTDLKMEMQVSTREIMAQLTDTLHQTFVDELNTKTELLQQQYSSLLENKKDIEINLSGIVELTKKQDGDISSQTKNLETFKKLYLEDITQIKGWYNNLKSKVEEYAVAFETLGIWKQGFNDSMIIVKQKTQENQSNHDLVISRLHELSLSQQKLELEVSKTRDLSTDLSLELATRLQAYNNQFDEIMDSISKLKSSWNQLDQSISSSQHSLCNQIESTNSDLRKFINSETKAITDQIQVDQKTLSDLLGIKHDAVIQSVMSVREQYDQLSNELNNCSTEIHTFKAHFNEYSLKQAKFSENHNMIERVSLIEEQIQSAQHYKSELLEATSRAIYDHIEKHETVIYEEISKQKDTITLELFDKAMNELEMRIPSLSSFTSILTSIGNLKECVSRVDQLQLPQIRTDLEHSQDLINTKIELLQQQIELVNTFKSSISVTVETQEHSISLMDTTVISLEEELTLLKAMMKEENTIQKNLLNNILDWKGSAQEELNIINQYNDEIREGLIKLSVLEENVETFSKTSSASINAFATRIANEEEKTNELEQNIVDIYKKIITLYGQLDMQGEASKLMENVIGIQELLAESRKKLQDMSDDTLDEMESHAQSLIADFYRLIDEKVVKTSQVLNIQPLPPLENQNDEILEYNSVMDQIELIQAERFASSSSSTERSPLDSAPGHLKRTTVDLSRKQPEYELPYSGPQQYNINNSGFDDNYDIWWEDGAGQKQWAYKDTYTTLSSKDVLLHTVYFLGWAISLWAFYRHFLQPTLAIHPATLIPMTTKQKEQAKELREKRLEEMEKYGIDN